MIDYKRRAIVEYEVASFLRKRRIKTSLVEFKGSVLVIKSKDVSVAEVLKDFRSSEGSLVLKKRLGVEYRFEVECTED